MTAARKRRVGFRSRVRRIAVNLYTLFLRVVSLPAVLSEYFAKDTGAAYGIGFWTKINLVRKMARNKKKIRTASDFFEHLTMATRIMNVPPDVEGCVVECGCFKGGSTANLSLVCALTDRTLHVFDSFAGLPEPDAADEVHAVPHLGQEIRYGKGAYCGLLDEVKNNVARWGNVSVCRWHQGYFETTVPDFAEPCVLVFLDVDLRGSLEVCVRQFWPRLVGGCCLFTHEADDLNIASLFFDREWWQTQVGEPAPGLIGAGCGLGLLPRRGGYRSALGYIVRNAAVRVTLTKVAGDIGPASRPAKKTEAVPS